MFSQPERQPLTNWGVIEIQGPPKKASLIESGYLPDYFRGDDKALVRAYAELASKQPDKFRDLRQFDDRQGKRNWVYDRRTSGTPGQQADPTQCLDTAIDVQRAVSRLDLTPCQQGVYDLLADEYTLTEIADRLGIHISTAQQHRQAIRDKLARLLDVEGDGEEKAGLLSE